MQNECIHYTRYANWANFQWHMQTNQKKVDKLENTLKYLSFCAVKKIVLPFFVEPTLNFEIKKTSTTKPNQTKAIHITHSAHSTHLLYKYNGHSWCFQFKSIKKNMCIMDSDIKVWWPMWLECVNVCRWDGAIKCRITDDILTSVVWYDNS